MSSSTDLFVEEARGVAISEAIDRLPIGTLGRASTTGERIGPCPACGGTDRFGVNVRSNKWVCRGAGGGRDAIGLAAHVLDLDVRRREDFLRACAAIVGRPVPEGAEETAEERRHREARIEERQRRNRAAVERTEAATIDFRQRERDRARSKWFGADRIGCHRSYLARRLAVLDEQLPALPFLRSIERELYWHGEDERGRLMSIHAGPAMVAPFVDPAGAVIGCHLTWVDLARAPKFRPDLFAPSDAARKAGARPWISGDPRPSEREVRDGSFEVLATKKMRGSKKGGVIPLVGYLSLDGRIVADPARPKMVTGEGIENVLAIGIAEGFPSDTIYCAAGDLGNLAGPADPASRFAHPDLRKPDRNGVLRRVFVQGPVPAATQGPEDAMQLPAHIEDVLLAADADSEPFATASAMERGRVRFSSSGTRASIAWPRPGEDFTDMLAG